MNQTPEHAEVVPIAQCDGKEPFKTHMAAEKALKRIHKKGFHQHSPSKKGTKIGVYPCPSCGQFHHGHQRNGKRRTPRSRRLSD